MISASACAALRVLPVAEEYDKRLRAARRLSVLGRTGRAWSGWLCVLSLEEVSVSTCPLPQEAAEKQAKAHARSESRIFGIWVPLFIRF